MTIRRTLPAALAAATALATAAPPGLAASAECDVTGDVRYTATAVRAAVTVDLRPCRLVGKVGSVTMHGVLARRDLVTGGFTGTVPARQVRCRAKAPTCTVRLTVPHVGTELAEYTFTASYDADGGRHVIAGAYAERRRCASVAATYVTCYVPLP